MNSYKRYAVYWSGELPEVDSAGKTCYSWELLHDSMRTEDAGITDAVLKRESSAAAGLSFTLYPGTTAWPQSDDGAYKLAVEPVRTHLLVAWVEPWVVWQNDEMVWADDDAAWEDVDDMSQVKVSEVVFVGRVETVDVSMDSDGLLSASVTAAETADWMNDFTERPSDVIDLDSLSAWAPGTDSQVSIMSAPDTTAPPARPLRTGANPLNDRTKTFCAAGAGFDTTKDVELEDRFPNAFTLKEMLDSYADALGLKWQQLYTDWTNVEDGPSGSFASRIYLREKTYAADKAHSIVLGSNLASYKVSKSLDGIHTMRVPYFGEFEMSFTSSSSKRVKTAVMMSDVWMYTPSLGTVDYTDRYKCHTGFLAAAAAEKAKSGREFALVWTAGTSNGALYPDAYRIALCEPALVDRYGSILEFYNAGNELGLNGSDYTYDGWPSTVAAAVKAKTSAKWQEFWAGAIADYIAQADPVVSIDVTGYDLGAQYGQQAAVPHLWDTCNVCDTISGETYTATIEALSLALDEPWKYDFTLSAARQQISKDN